MNRTAFLLKSRNVVKQKKLEKQFCYSVFNEKSRNIKQQKNRFAEVPISRIVIQQRRHG
jgi:hypothetical protein